MTDFEAIILDTMRAPTAAAVYDSEKGQAYVISLINEMAADYEIENIEHEFSFHNGWQSHAGGVYQIKWHAIFGDESMEHFYTNGPREYKRLQTMLDSRGLDKARGFDGLRILVLHEFAHSLQYYFRQNGFDYVKTYSEYSGTRYRTSQKIKPHGIEFKEFYAELLDRYATEVR